MATPSKPSSGEPGSYPKANNHPAFNDSYYTKIQEQLKNKLATSNTLQNSQRGLTPEEILAKVGGSSIPSIPEYKPVQPTPLPPNFNQYHNDINNIDNAIPEFEGGGYIDDGVEHEGDTEIDKGEIAKSQIDASDFDYETAAAGVPEGRDPRKTLENSTGGVKQSVIDTESRRQEEKKSKTADGEPQGSIKERVGNLENKDSGQNNDSSQATRKNDSTTTTSKEKPLISAAKNNLQNIAANSNLGQGIQNTANQIQTVKKNIQTVKKGVSIARVLFGLGGSAPAWVSVLVAALLITLLGGATYGVWRTMQARDESGGGADEFFLTGFSSPSSCTRSAVEAAYGITDRLNAVKLGRSILTPTAEGVYSYESNEAMNQYAKFAAIAVQATSNLIRTGTVRDKSIENPLANTDNPYNNGVVINDQTAAIIESFLNKPIEQPVKEGEPPKDPIRNILGYDADTAKTKIEGAGLALIPDSVTGLTYALPPKIQYFDTQNLATLADGESGRVIVGGDVAIRDANGVVLQPAAITRKAFLHESLGIETADFAEPASTPPEPRKELPYKIDQDSPPTNPDGTDNEFYQRPYIEVAPGVGEYPLYDNQIPGVPALSRDYLTNEQAAEMTSLEIEAPATGAENRLTDGTLVSFNAVSVGANVKVAFGVRIPFVSDIIEGIINGIINALLHFDLLKQPVLSSSYYRMANVGSFGSTLLNNFDANQNHPFINYTGHIATNDRNNLTQSLYNSYLGDGVKGAAGVDTLPGTGASTSIDGVTSDTTASDADDSTEAALENNPQVKHLRTTQELAKAPATTASSPELTSLWQGQVDPAESLKSAMSNITDQFLLAGNLPRTVSGVNLAITLNVTVNLAPTSIYLTLPAIRGAYAKKNISNGPNGREYVDLYNKVGIAVMKAVASEDWPTDISTFNTGFFADTQGIAEGMEAWIGECKSERYDEPSGGGGLSSSFSHANNLNSCKLYEKNTGNYKSVYDSYLPNIESNPNRYLSQEDKARVNELLDSSGWQVESNSSTEKDYRRAYYENIIIAEAEAQGIDPTDGINDETDRTALAYILATAAYETNMDYKPNNRSSQELDFIRFSEINPTQFTPMNELFAQVGTGDVLGTLDSLLIKPFSDRVNDIQSQGAGATGANSREGDILILTLDTIAGMNEAYGVIGKGVSDAAVGALNEVLVGKLTGLLGNLGLEAKTDLQSIIKKWYKQTETGDIFSGFFDDDVVGYVFDPNQYGHMYYGRGFAPSAIRGKSVYKKLEQVTGKSFTFDPNAIRDDPSSMAQTLIAGMKSGAFTGYRLNNFFDTRKADPINARALIDPNFVFTTTGLSPTLSITPTNTSSITPASAADPRSPERNPELTIPDKLILDRYRYYYDKVGNMNSTFYTYANKICNSDPDGMIFKDNIAANACIKEGYNVLNTTDPKSKYQSYGFTITANAGTPIYPLFGGKILNSNFATKRPPAASSESSTTDVEPVNESDIKERRIKGDPASGNQVSIVSNVDGGLYVVRYTNLQGRVPPIARPTGDTNNPSVIVPGTSINKDDIIGFVGNSGPGNNGVLPETAVRVEIVKYYGNGLEYKTEDIFSSVRDFGQLQNPLYYIKNKFTTDVSDAMPLCEPTAQLNYNQYPISPVEGVRVPGVNTEFDTWLLLK